MNILADASLSDLEAAFPSPFRLHYYHHLNEVSDKLSGMDILLCRSTLKINPDFFKNSPIRYVATASSGIDHINLAYLNQKGIQLFAAHGSNAIAVADYVVSCLAYLQKTQLLPGKKAGIIGAGAVGQRVLQHLVELDFSVQIYDPLKALAEPNFKSCALTDLYTCDLICVHANLHDDNPYPSKNLLDEFFLSQLQAGTVIINAARGEIVNEQAILDRSNLIYCTDVYAHEPDVNKDIIDYATICTPHIAGHSIESKRRAIYRLSEQLHEAYQLPCPVFPHDQMIDLPHYNSWQDKILAIYNPQVETKQLKEAKDMAATFLKLRAAHKQRHDFYLYR